MDKHTYVTRLKKMLTGKKKPCNCCPIAQRFAVDRNFINNSSEGCFICQRFVGLKVKPDNSYIYYGPQCPCDRPPRKGTVVERAWRKIEEYEDKHGVIEI